MVADSVRDKWNIVSREQFLRTVHGTELEWRLCLGSVPTSNICSRQNAPAFSWDASCPTGTKKACLAWRRDARRTRRPQALSGPRKMRRFENSHYHLFLCFYHLSFLFYSITLRFFSWPFFVSEGYLFRNTASKFPSIPFLLSGFFPKYLFSYLNNFFETVSRRISTHTVSPSIFFFTFVFEIRFLRKNV